MWLSGVFDLDLLKGLLRAAFFIAANDFACVVVWSTRILNCQGLNVVTGQTGMFIMNTSKNKQGGLNQMELDHKVVPVLASPSAKECCPVYVLDCYINKLQKEAEQKDLF